MPRGRDDTPASRPAGEGGGLRPAHRVAVLILLLVLVSVVRYVADRPSLAISLYALIPIVLGVYWFGLAGGMVAAGAATALLLADELVSPSEELADGMLWVAVGNRALVFFGVAALVALLLIRERRLTRRLYEQQEQLSEFQALRSALTPSGLPERPQLQIASSFTPAEGLVGGDFYLVVEGPGGSTTVVVGDAVGHGLEAARSAAFVRAAMATFARFSRDPVQLLELADAALTEHGQTEGQFVTAVCVNLGPPPARQLVWASAGHDVPWLLDTAAPLAGGRVRPPLGTGAGIAPEAGRARLSPGQGVLLFTDGLTEGRAPRRPDRRPCLFGEDRARQIVQQLPGASPDQVLQALSSAVLEFAGGPLADDLCLVALRAHLSAAGGRRPAAPATTG
jgi:serine phosphatase RsbU (regulator of sigma subunit)